MPLQCQSAGSKHCLSAAVYLEGTAFKQQSQLFDTSPSHLSAQPSPDVKAHLPIKHSHKTLIHPLFRLYGLSSHNYPWSHNQRLILRLGARAVGMYMSVRDGERKWGGGGLDRGRTSDMCEWKNGPFMYRQVRRHKRAEQHANTHKHKIANLPPPTPTPPPPPTISLWPFLSLPLAVSQIPDDVLTGGLSDWRWGCVMTDQGPLSVTSTLPACCLKINWQIERPPPPKKKKKKKRPLFFSLLPSFFNFFRFFFFFF